MILDHVSAVHPGIWKEQLPIASNSYSLHMHEAGMIWISLTWCFKLISYVIIYFFFYSRSTVFLVRPSLCLYLYIVQYSRAFKLGQDLEANCENIQLQYTTIY